MKRYITIGLAIIIGLWGFISVQLIVHYKTENNRLNANQESLMEGVAYYKTKDSLSVASVKMLELNRDEFKQHNAELMKMCEELHIKVKNLQSVSQTATKSTYEVRTIVRDTIIYEDKIDTFLLADYYDNYLSLNYMQSGDSARIKIETFDTLTHIIHVIPKQWWFFKWGVKAIQQEVISSNPYSQITYTKYIEIKKKRRKRK